MNTTMDAKSKNDSRINATHPTPDSGLCFTCNSCDHCAFRNTLTDPVVYCEEFDNFQESPALVSSAALSDTASVHSYHGNAPGLCVTCDHRQQCVSGVHERTIWYCEQFQ